MSTKTRRDGSIIVTCERCRPEQARAGQQQQAESVSHHAARIVIVIRGSGIDDICVGSTFGISFIVCREPARRFD
jgi:hypothetical protein